MKIKNAFWVIVACFNLSVGIAQDFRGRFIMNASISVIHYPSTTRIDNSIISDDEDYNHVDFSLRGGYFLTESFAIGMAGSYNFYSNSGNNYDPGGTLISSGTSKNTRLGGGLFAEKLYSISNKVFFIVSLSSFYEKTKSKNYQEVYSILPSGVSTTTIYKSDNSQIGILSGISPGLQYFLTNKVVIRGFLGGIRHHYRVLDSPNGVGNIITKSGNHLSLDFNTGLTLGVGFYF